MQIHITTIRAGNAVAIEATSGDLTGRGVQIAAGYDANGNRPTSGDANAGNVLLSAGHDIILQSAQAMSESSSKSTSAGASIGIDGVTGFSASAGTGKMNEAGVTQVNSHVTESGAVALNRGVTRRSRAPSFRGTQ